MSSSAVSRTPAASGSCRAFRAELLAGLKELLQEVDAALAAPRANPLPSERRLRLRLVAVIATGGRFDFQRVQDLAEAFTQASPNTPFATDPVQLLAHTLTELAAWAVSRRRLVDDSERALSVLVGSKRKRTGGNDGDDD